MGHPQVLKQVLLSLLIGLVFEATGVVFLSRGLKQIGEPAALSLSAIGGLIKSGITNPSVLLGVFLEATFFGTLLYLLSHSEVSFIWPLTSFGLVLTTFAAKFILREEVNFVRWMGVILIVVGSGLITYSEKMKERKVAAPPDVAVAGSEMR